MADNTTGESSESQTPNEEFEKITKSELEDLRLKASRHEINGARARKLEKEANELRALLAENERLEAEDAAKSNDFSKQLELSKKREAELVEKLQTKDKEIERRVKQVDGIAVASKYSTNPNAIVKLIWDDIVIEKDENDVLIAKSKTGESLEAFIEKATKELLPETYKNSRKSGTGTFAPDDKNQGSDSMTYDKLKNMDSEKRTVALRDPKNRRVWLSGS